MSITDAELAKQLPNNYGFKPWYRLRWRFEFSDGRPDEYGQWNGDSIPAWKVNKQNLLWAVIEGEKIGAWTTKVFVRIPGHLYATAKWVTITSIPAMPQGMKAGKRYKRPGTIIGLCFHTNDEAFHVFVTGQVHRGPLDENQRKFDLREHRTEV